MDTIFLNQVKLNKTSYTHRLLFNQSYKINLKCSDKYIAL